MLTVHNFLLELDWTELYWSGCAFGESRECGCLVLAGFQRRKQIVKGCNVSLATILAWNQGKGGGKKVVDVFLKNI